MPPNDFKISTETLWQGALIFALLDAICVPLMVWRVKPELFQRIKWVLAIIAGLVWFGIWRWAIGYFWETVYIYVFPTWGERFIPIVFALLNALIALGLWKLALHLRANPVVGYCFVGGLWGALTHIWAVYRGVVSKPPMLRGASPVAAVVIAFFEYIFYWCVILTLSALGWWVGILSRKGTKILKRMFTLIVVLAVFLTGCGGDLSEPPLVYLVSHNGLVDGFQGSYCWDDGIAGVICKDTVAPHFESSIPLDAGAPIRFQLDPPLPKEVTIAISKEVLGETIFSETMPTSEFIDWSPAVAPGKYIVYVHAKWKPGELTYWFSVSLE